MNARYQRGRFRALALLVALVTMCSGGVASARRPRFGPGVDDVPLYDGQSFCSPAPKPGVLAFQRAVYARHPRTGSLGISRACHIGGRSEHKEGRAWDWAVNAAVRWQRRAARDVINWLLERDRFGNVQLAPGASGSCTSYGTSASGSHGAAGAPTARCAMERAGEATEPSAIRIRITSTSASRGPERVSRRRGGILVALSCRR